MVRAVQAWRDAAAQAAGQAVDALDTLIDTFQNPSTANQALVAAVVLQLPLHLEMLPCAVDCAREEPVHLETKAEARARARTTFFFWKVCVIELHTSAYISIEQSATSRGTLMGWCSD